MSFVMFQVPNDERRRYGNLRTLFQITTNWIVQPENLPSVFTFSPTGKTTVILPAAMAYDTR